MNFLWGYKAKRLSHLILTLPKNQGGIGFPDPFKYYYVVHLTRALDWTKHASEKQCVGMEQAGSSFSLSTLLWHTSALPVPRKSHPLIGTTLSVVEKTGCVTRVFHTPSPLSLVIGAQEFSSSLSGRRFREFLLINRYRFQDFHHKGR